MLKLRALTKDKPYDSLENAIWWIEFVMRHNGAPHLRFNGIDTAWYQQFDLDIIAFLTITSFLVLCALLAIVGWGLKLLHNIMINNQIRDQFKPNKVFEMFMTKKIKSA